MRGVSAWLASFSMPVSKSRADKASDRLRKCVEGDENPDDLAVLQALNELGRAMAGALVDQATLSAPASSARFICHGPWVTCR
jgi:hypothetical protein